MKIGIFGDSFADDYNMWPSHFEGVGPSWIDYIRNQNIEVDNYASGGSGLYYSYEKFISSFEKYDRIIFLVSTPGRITISKNGEYGHWFSLNQVEKELAACFDYEKKVRLNAIYSYFKYVKNDQFDNLVHDMLIERILKTHDKVLMIPSFGWSRIQELTPFVSISEFEAAFWNLTEVLPNDKNLYDARKCHMCEENNLMVGEEVFNWIKTDKFNIDSKKFRKPIREFEHYFRPKPW
jgi:hypothetical protein